MRDKKRFDTSHASLQTLYNAAGEREQNIIGKAISEARAKKGLSRDALCGHLALHGLKIQRTGLYRWEAGDSIPNAYQLLAVCQELEIRDLFGALTTLPAEPQELNEEGLRKLAEYKQDLIASGRYRPKESAPGIVYIEMPISTLSASAGTGEFLADENFEMVRVPSSSVPKAADFGIHVNGDSMEPIYQDGQLVWVEACSELREGDVGLFMYDGSGYIKVYHEQAPRNAAEFTDSSGVLHPQPVLISYNEQYAPKIVSPELGFSIVGRVLS